MSASLSLTMSTAESPQRLVGAVESFVETNGLSPRSGYLLDLVLEEIVTNVINHGAGTSEATIAVDITHDGKYICGTVRDDAAPFDPLARAPVDVGGGIDEREIGGLGIHLVREMTDSVSYAREDGHNVLTFRIDVTKEPS